MRSVCTLTCVYLLALCPGCLADLHREDSPTRSWRKRVRLELERLSSTDEQAAASRQLSYTYSKLTDRQKREFRKWAGPKLLSVMQAASAPPASLIKLVDELDPRGTLLALTQVLDRSSRSGSAEAYVASASALLRRGAPPHLAVAALTVASITGHLVDITRGFARRMGCSRISPHLLKILEGKDRATVELLFPLGLNEPTARAFALRAAAETASTLLCTELGPAALVALSENRRNPACAPVLARTVGLLSPARGSALLIQMLQSEETHEVLAAASGLAWIATPTDSLSSALATRLKGIATQASTSGSDALYVALVRAAGRILPPKSTGPLRELLADLRGMRRRTLRSALSRIDAVARCSGRVSCLLELLKENRWFVAERTALELARLTLNPQDRSKVLAALNTAQHRASAHPAVRFAARISHLRLQARSPKDLPKRPPGTGTNRR